MKLIAIDTATEVCGIALTDNNRLLAEQRLHQKNIHNERLVSAIQHLSESVGWQIDDFKAIALSIGPGSFTGLRIGISVAKGFACSLDIPIVSVNTLDAMALSAQFWSGRIFTVIKARTHECYFGDFVKEGRQIKLNSEYEVLSIENIKERVQKDILMLCSPFELMSNFMSSEYFYAHSAGFLMSPLAIAELGYRKLQSGQTEDADSLEPFYLKEFAAKRKVYQYD
ncbi:MAG: tRNA (adenosine(37)-N6)-threonylcarbamoyltransferase complex dimerization subunit type 1 TsaB [bacterium]